MSSVIFENDGVIDPRAFRVFGISAKETENPIGFFGTGLKYAIAICLREGCKVEIFSGGTHEKFTKEIFEMRGKSFEGIAVNGEALPFTTELGKNWQLWQAFRELYCNCTDEHGSISLGDSTGIPDSKGRTVVRVTGSKFEQCWYDRADIILQLSSKDKVVEGAVEIWPIPSRSIYYRGIKVFELSKPAMFTYNVTSLVELTEDRTVKSPHYLMAIVARSVATLKDRGLVLDVLTAATGFIESEFEYATLAYYDSDVSEEFLEVVAREYQANNDKINRSARDYYARKVQSSRPKTYEPAQLTVVEAKQLARAQFICNQMWEDFSTYKILVVKNLGQQTMALADRGEATIVLSKRCFEMGTKFLVSTMIEEYMHLRTGYNDHTRELQTHLFDTICTIIENHVLKDAI